MTACNTSLLDISLSCTDLPFSHHGVKNVPEILSSISPECFGGEKFQFMKETLLVAKITIGEVQNGKIMCILGLKTWIRHSLHIGLLIVISVIYFKII